MAATSGRARAARRRLPGDRLGGDLRGRAPAAWRDGRAAFGPGEPVSGGYSVVSAGAGEIVLQRNERYWAGPPNIPTVRLILDIGGRSPIAAFEADDIDYTDVPTFDAPWIPYDRASARSSANELARPHLPRARHDPGPFDDVRVDRHWARRSTGLASSP